MFVPQITPPPPGPVNDQPNLGRWDSWENAPILNADAQPAPGRVQDPRLNDVANHGIAGYYLQPQLPPQVGVSCFYLSAIESPFD